MRDNRKQLLEKLEKRIGKKGYMKDIGVSGTITNVNVTRNAPDARKKYSVTYLVAYQSHWGVTLRQIDESKLEVML